MISLKKHVVLFLTCQLILSSLALAGDAFDVGCTDGLLRISRFPDAQEWASLQPTMTAELAKGESESMQVVFRAREEVEITDLDVTFEALRHEETGAVLPASPEPICMVAYLNPTDESNSKRWPAPKHNPDVPDPLRPVPRTLHLNKGEALTLWVTVTIPREATAGLYRSRLAVKSRSFDLSVPAQVHVWDVALPANTNVQTQLFSLSLAAIAHYAAVESPRAVSPAWADVIERCVNLHRNYRISPARAALLGVGGVLKVPGKVGWAGHFDGHSTSHVISLPEALVDLPEYTMMSWIRATPGDERERQLVWTAWRSGEGFKVLFDSQQGVSIYARRKKPEKWSSRASAPMTAGQWHHVALVCTTESMELFIDGDRGCRISSPPNPMLRKVVILGSYPYMNSRLYNGDQDEFRVFDRALDKAAIKDEMERTAGESQAVVQEPFDDLPKGIGSVYTEAGEEVMKAWFQFWRSEGLHLGNVTAPGAYKYNRVDFRTADAFFSRYYPYLQENGWLPYTYTRMPVDESMTGRGYKVNASYGRWLGEHYPGVNRHHTIGDHIEDKKLEQIKNYAGCLDIWDFTPGVWKHRGCKAVEWLDQRRAEHGERFSWYLTRSSPVARGRLIHPIGLRGFFWQMRKHDVTMLNHWNITIWSRPHGLDQWRRNLRWCDNERCYHFHATTAAGVASATFWWPSENGPLPSMRWAAIRDGIEDFDLCSLVLEGAANADKADAAISELSEVVERVRKAQLRFIGLAGFSTDFGGPENFRGLRRKIGRVAVRLGKGGFLSQEDALPSPPKTMPWRRFVEAGEPVP